jgi:protein-disulfide isomerase
MNRRTFITAAGAGAVSLAGCLGGTESGTEPDDADSPADPTGGGSGDGSLGGHPAAVGLADQPALGPDPTSAPAAIITFSDPSCPSCARFEDTTVPEIESKLVETGKAAFVYRGMPIIYPWGEPATRVLEATFDHDAGTFWTLKDHYYENREEFDTDNVFEKTESFLAENTDVDAEAVVSAAEAGEYDAAVEADLAAGEEAGVRGTPTSFLFKDGEHVTTVGGAKSYTVFAEALGY